MKIEKITEKDKGFLETFKATEWPDADLKHYKNGQPDFSKIDQTLLAKNSDGDIVAYITFSIDTGITHLQTMIVGKEFRRLGIASKLIHEAEKLAKHHKSHKIWLETGSEWPARFLYEKHGYTIRCSLPNHYGNQEFLLMDKKL